MRSRPISTSGNDLGSIRKLATDGVGHFNRTDVASAAEVLGSSAFGLDATFLMHFLWHATIVAEGCVVSWMVFASQRKIRRWRTWKSPANVMDGAAFEGYNELLSPCRSCRVCVLTVRHYAGSPEIPHPTCFPWRPPGSLPGTLTQYPVRYELDLALCLLIPAWVHFERENKCRSAGRGGHRATVSPSWTTAASTHVYGAG